MLEGMQGQHRRSVIEITGRAKGEGPRRRWPCTISSETPVTRSDFGGSFEEVLSHAPGAVDLSRAPLPVLEGHDATRTNIGLIERLNVVGGRLRGELVLGASKRALELAPDIDAGIVSGLSVGYQILEFARSDDGGTLTATLWQPYECSIVGVPGEDTVGINRSLTMPESTDPTAPPTSAAPVENTRGVMPDGGECSCDEADANYDPECDCEAAAAATEPPAKRALSPVKRERERAAAIQRAASYWKIDPSFATRLISNGTPVTKALDLLASEGERLDIARHGSRGIGGPPDLHSYGRGSHAGGVPAGGDHFRSAAVDALLLRSGVSVAKPHPAARDITPSTLEIARTCLSRSGQRAHRQTPELLIRAAMTTSDFPLILEDVINKAIRKGWETEPASHTKWVRSVPVNDFRLQHRPILGSAPALQVVLEGGEYTQGGMDEDSTSYRVQKWGKVVAVTLEMLTNDTLDAFIRIQPAMGQAARRAEADTVYAMFAENAGAGPTMQDSVALFHANHGNVTATGGIGATQLGLGRTLLRRQTALGGGYMALQPRLVLCSPEHETALELVLAASTRVYNAAMTSATFDAALPQWLSGLPLVVEPRLTGAAIFLIAGTDQIDTAELGLLDDGELGGGPTIETDDSFLTDERRFKVRHAFGAKFLDWRGIVKIPIS